MKTKLIALLVLTLATACVSKAQEYRIFDEGGTNIAGNGIDNPTDYKVIRFYIGGTNVMELHHDTGLTIPLCPTNFAGSASLLQPFFVRTNWISGLVYSNSSGRGMIVQATANHVGSLILGSSRMELVTGNSYTNSSGFDTLLVGGLVRSGERQMLSAYVNTNELFYFTNRSSGLGNSATLTPGSGFFHSQ